MAQFPCDHHGARYQGAQQTLYPALVKGTARLGHKSRVCPSCMTTAYEWIQANMRPAESELGVFDCWDCGSSTAEWALFVTVYRDGAEREDFYGRTCADHATAAAMALMGPAHALLTI